MAEREQIEQFIALIDEACPTDMFRAMDKVNLGIGAVIKLLEKSGGSATAGQISEAHGVSTARVAALIKKMSAKGLVEKAHDEHDARVTVVRLTEQGRQLAESRKRDMYRDVGRMIDEIGMERLRDFLATAADIKRIFTECGEKCANKEGEKIC